MQCLAKIREVKGVIKLSVHSLFPEKMGSREIVPASLNVTHESHLKEIGHSCFKNNFCLAESFSQTLGEKNYIGCVCLILHLYF